MKYVNKHFYFSKAKKHCGIIKDRIKKIVEQTCYADEMESEMEMEIISLVSLGGRHAPSAWIPWIFILMPLYFSFIAHIIYFSNKSI